MQLAQMRRRRAGACLVAVAIALTAATAAAQEVTVAPKLRAGDRFRLEVTRTREHTARPQQNGHSTTVVDVRVIAATPEGMTLEWAPGATTFQNPAVAADPLLEAVASVSGNLRLHLKLTPEGELTGLANQADVEATIRTVVDLVLKDLLAKVSDEQRPQLQTMMGQLLSPAVLVGTITRDAQLYFFMNGVTFTVGEPIEADLEQPSPFGKGVIPTTLRMVAKSATNETAALTMTTTYDGASLLQIGRALAEQGGTKLTDEEFARVPPLQMSDDGTYALDRALGLMREVVVNRHVNAGPNRRHDGWTIRLLKAPAR
jgi:hypothetical protein